MRKKMLSMILAVSLILGNCSSSFVAVAEDGLPTETTTTEEREDTTETSTNEQDTEPGETVDDTPNDETKAPDETNGSDTQVVFLNVEKIQDITLYQGQNPTDILNYQMGNGKPRYSEYFKFHADDATEVSDEIYDEISMVDLTDRTTEVNPLSYTIGFECNENCGYAINDSFRYSFTLGTDYDPQVAVMKTEDFLYLTCPEEYGEYYISDNNANFISNKILIESLTDNQYYLRNMNQDSINYLAISRAFKYEASSGLELFPIEVKISEDATILNSAYYTNQDVTVNFSCAGQTSMVNMILEWEENGVKKTSELTPETSKKNENGKKRFSASYTFKAQENKVTEIRSLHLKVSDVANENDSVENTFAYADNCWSLRLDTIKPIVSNATYNIIESNNTNKAVFDINVEGKSSPVKYVDYKFESDNKWTNVRNDILYGMQSVRLAIDNNRLFEVLFVRVVDVSGNITYARREIPTNPMGNYWNYNLTDIDDNSGVANTDLLDSIKSVKLYYTNSENPSDEDWKDISDNTTILKSNKLWNAISARYFRIAFVYNDMSNSNGIKIDIGTGKSYNLIAHSKQIDEENSEIDYYYYDISAGSSYDLTILKNNGASTMSINTIADKFPDGISIQSSIFVVDIDKPTARLDRPGFASLNAAVSNKWYGIKEKDGQENYFTINVSDNASGIYSLAITDNGSKIVTNEELPPVEFTINNDSTETYRNGELTTQFYYNLDSAAKDIQVKIPLALFNIDGDHTLKITVVDNAGNTETGFAIINGSTNEDSDGANKPFEFSTDYNRPTGSITILNLPDPIDGKYWYDGSATVQFQFAINESNPNKVVWKANNASEVEVKYTDPDTTVTQSTADTNASLDGNHSYNISAKFYDQAGNCSEDDATDAKTFYKDTEPPTIDSVSVSRAPESGFGKVLRILTFGIFSNDTVTVTVTAHDGEHDSGLNNNALKISLDDGATYNGMDFQDGKYKYTILISDTPQSGYFTFKVTDQFGHYSELTKESEDGNVSITADGETPEDSDRATDSKFYMFETIPPSVSIDLPESDGVDVVARPDTCTWFNSDKDITITVSDENSGIHNIAVTVNDEAILTDSDNVNFISKCAVMDNDSHKYRLSIEGLREILKNSGKLPGDGHYIVKVTAEDNSGNIKEDSVDYFLDYDAPAVIKIEFSIPSEEGGLTEGDVFDAAQYIEKLQYGYYFKTDLTATVHISDVAPSSELHRIHYELVSYNNGVKGDTVDSGTVAINSQRHEGDGTVDSKGTAQFTIPKDFKGQILVTAYDYVGNESAERTPDLFVVDTPEHHESESHIDISGFGNAGYSDGEGHPLYDSNVTLTVKITDTMSGIRQISYEMNSEQNKQEKKTIDIANTGNAMNQDLGDGWHITAMDENLVTEVTKEYTFSSDDNNIQLLFEMTDRSNNSSAKQSDVFSIDQTAPVINVAFANAAGNGEFYRESRTATITVTERNFDPNKIIASIQNSIGGTPTLGFTDNSNTEHVATLTFGEGDYSFSIEGTDLCNHTATVNYSGGNEQSFHVDLKDPLIVDNFTDFINDLENSFNVDKEMTFTITEHNFTANGVNIHVYRVPAGQELTDGNREDCTSEYVTDNMWTSNGDTHNAGFTFSTDYVYQVSITVTDKSGRTPATLTSPVFEIDKTKPVLKTPDNRDKLVYTKKSTQTEADSIVFEDSNIDKIAYSVVAYQMELNEDNVGYDVKVSEPKKFEVNTDSVIISDDYFKNDGIYEVKSVAYDVAGNASDESTHTYVIQRNTDFLVYIPDSNKENQTGLYKFNEKGIRSADFEDIEIISYVTADKSVGVRVGDEDVEGDDIDIKELRGSDLGGDKKNDETINQVTAYDLTLKNSFIAQNYDSDTIDTDLLLNAVASTEDAQQVITLGHIYIDNVKPVGEYEQAIQNLGFFDGFYGVESRSVMIEGVSPDIDLDRCEIQANDLTLKAADGGFVYDENAHTISFTINKGYTDIRPTLVDKAGNINNLPLVKKVYVGGVFARFWYLFIFGGLLVLAIPTLIIMALIKKKKSQPIFK